MKICIPPFFLSFRPILDEMRVLICFSIPRNTGDHALLESMVYMILKKYPQTEITVACDYPELEFYYKKVRFIYDIELAIYRSKYKFYNNILAIWQKIGWKFGLSKKIKSRPFWKTSHTREFWHEVKNSDCIILSPGSYLNSFYDLDYKLSKIISIVDTNPNVMLLGQSVGPISERHLDKWVSVMKSLKKVEVREAISYSLMRSHNIRATLSTDYAFALKEKTNIVGSQRSNEPGIKSIVMNVRKWRNDWLEIKEKFVSYLDSLLSMNDEISITFISTCQGLSDYVNDSTCAREIINLLPSYVSRLHIDDRHFRPEEMIEILSQFDAYVGMRLHGALLSLVAGTPAMVIGYETKSDGIYKAMGLKNLSIHYKDPLAKWLNVTQQFFNKMDEHRSTLPQIIHKQLELLNSQFSLDGEE